MSEPARTTAGKAMPQGRPAARSEGGAATGSEDIARAEARAERKQPRLTPADLHRAVTGERALILAHIAGKIRACEAAAAKDSGPDAPGYRITLHRLTVLRDEIAAGLHVPDLPHQEEPKA